MRLKCAKHNTRCGDAYNRLVNDSFELATAPDEVSTDVMVLSAKPVE
jgi:hypothetical protein